MSALTRHVSTNDWLAIVVLQNRVLQSIRLFSSSSSSSLFPEISVLRSVERAKQKRGKLEAMKLTLFMLILSFNLLGHVFADQIFPAHVGGTLGRSSTQPKYKVEFHPQDSPFNPEDDQESMVMPDKNGQKYLCYLPREEMAVSGEPVLQHNTSSMIVETEKPIKLKTPDELLEALKDRCLIRQEGWWSYEFCYEKKLRQLHLEDDKVVQEFILGEYDAEATAAFNQNLSDVSTVKDPRSIDASQRYHAHQYKNGTLCDLTNEPRETEVRFVCSEPRAMISSITELSTCKYALTIQSPMLCKHPLFQEERPVWHTIDCNMLPEDQTGSKAKEDDVENQQIVMVTENESQSDPASEE